MVKTIVNKDFYNFYKTSTENDKGIVQIHPFKVFDTVINEFNTFCMKQILSGHEVDLPSKLGKFWVIGSRIDLNQFNKRGTVRSLRVDWVTTKKMWEQYPEKKEAKELFYFFNEHSDGVNYSLRWLTAMVNLVNKSFYTFVPARHNKRLLAKLIKSESVEYIIKEKGKKIFKEK